MAASVAMDHLLQPISEDQPAGPDLEYSDVADFLRLVEPRQDRRIEDGRETVVTIDPNWRSVVAVGNAVLGKTKDLRVAMGVTFGLLNTSGLKGFSAGLQLMHRLLADFWPTLYPRLDASDGDDPYERINVLASLGSDQAVGAALHDMVILESREVGRFTVRDLEVVAGRLQARQGETAPTQALLAGAWERGNPEDNAARQQAASDILEALAGIRSTFADKAPGHDPDLEATTNVIKRVLAFYQAQSADPAADAGQQGPDLDNSATEGGGGGAAAAGRARQGLQSRADVSRQLGEVATYLRRTEPTNPAILFIDRAMRIMDMDFLALVKDLMPDSKDRIEMIGGVTFSDDD